MHGSVSTYIDAPPERVWSLVSDVTNTRRFSPETFEAEWLDGATGPSCGIRFRGHVRRNGRSWMVYWTTCTITECEPEHAFAFEVQAFRGKPAVTWSYRFESAGEGTRLTESFELGGSLGLRLYAALADRSRTRTNIKNMRTTLDRVRLAAESLG